MAEMWDAVVAGHICVDVIPDLANIPPDEFQSMFQPGRLLEAGPVAFSTGGAVSNTGLVLHKLGIQTQLMGKIGDDLFGEAIRKIISGFDASLVDGMVVDSAAQTSYSVVINPPQVDRIFLHYPGANDSFFADDVRYDLVAQSRLFHFGYPPIMKSMYQNGGSELIDIYQRSKAAGVTTSLDLSLPDPTSPSGRAPWQRILEDTLPSVDIFLPSAEEILFMLRRGTFDDLQQNAGGIDILPLVTPQLLNDLSSQLLEMGTKIVGIKLGDRGIYLRTGGEAELAAIGRAKPSNPGAWANRELWAPAFQVGEVGTTGAGDSTIAGFLSALLRDLSPEKALVMATAVGACNVEAADSLSGIRSWQATLDRVAAGWAKRHLAIDAAGWHFDEANALWAKESSTGQRRT
ncbi:MAG: carbohydrate kinase family protein [Chloroflexota bacterium]|nr:carbohydrate kinase family protein [Chloroflexota bacterium]